MSQPFVAEIKMFAGNFAPRGFAFCAGQTMSISQNSALFALLGTTYGGNGTVTFGLPDLQGRVPMGAGAGSGLTSRAWGEKAGGETTSILTSNLPQHTHPLLGSANVGTQNAPVPNAMLAQSSQRDAQFVDLSGAGALVSMGPTGIAGGNVPISIVQPYLAIYFIIALQGVFPSRN